MNPRIPTSSGAWRQRFLAIARQAQAAGPRPPAPAGLRIRSRLGAPAGRRFGALAARP